MESVQFIDLNAATVFLLVLIGFISGMVSGFIGSGGAFVLTPAMMSLGAPGMVAVASNICHKFPKALVGAVKRHKYGQVDVKLGLILGLFAELGMLLGKQVMTGIKHSFGHTGTDLYVSVIFIVVLAVVGGYVLRDYRKLRNAPEEKEFVTPKLALWIQAVNIPGTMVNFPVANVRISLLFLIPAGIATGMLAATIAVGGFIGVPAMIYIFGVPAIMASATELVIAFVMGLGGTFLYGLEGVVDVRLSMLILLGSLFGIQLGAIGTTYVKDYQVKLVMAVIMLTVLFSRFFYIPGYLSKLNVIAPLDDSSIATLTTLGDSVLAVALILGAVTVLTALTKGIGEHRKGEMAQEVAARMAALAPAHGQIAPGGRLERIMVATDGSEFSAGAVQTAVELARATGARLYITGIAVYNPEYASTVPGIEQTALAKARADVAAAVAVAADLNHVEVVVESADPYLGIVEAAEEYNVDLIVMGRRGIRGLARDVLGVATARVIGHAPCSVLVAPRGVHLDKGDILVATDGSRYGDAEVWTAGRLAKLLSRQVIAVSAVLPSHNEVRRQQAVTAIEQAKAGLGVEHIQVTGIVTEGRAEQVIVDQALKTGAAMIVVGTHGRTSFERLLMGSVAERVIGFADRPVLVVRM
ncbi:MAG: universal stress protein [Gammaproteobacteria bacterium]|nr:universal stress protein [Gammaproteobacteria bacterium]MBU1480181.1 universal stress protein [Gammaproteobacteria bacterium]